METRLNRFLRTRPLAALSLTIVLGAAAGVCSAGSLIPFLLCAAGFSVVAIVISAMKWPNRFAAWLCAILFLSAGYGAWRSYRPEMVTVRDAEIAGIVADAPEWQSDKQRAVFHLKDATVNGESAEQLLRVYAYGELAREITLADEISMQTNLYEPNRSGNGAFDFCNYLWAEGVSQYASLEAFEISVIPKDGGFMERMAEVRLRLQNRVETLFPRNAALLKGLILGDRTDMAEEDEVAFAESGIMHLLAVSGLHVSLLAMALTALGTLLCIPKSVMMVLVTLLLCVYAVLCGGAPSIIRAVIMYLLMQGGVVLRRSRDPMTRLCVACAAMALFNPMYLRQTGFQLSFAAVAGLTMLAPTMTLLRDRLPEAFRKGPLKWLTDAMFPGAAAQLSSLPIVISAFGQVSWMSLLLNVVCIPLAQIALMLGLAALLLDMLIPVAPLAMAADLLTGYLLSAAHWAANLPFGLLHIPAMTLPFVILYVICALLATAQFKTKLRTRLIALCMLPVLVAGSAAYQNFAISQAEFQVTFLDVEQGDAALINADGTLYLMDVGDGETVAEYVSDHQLEIEGIFLSHAHDDHAGGLSEILAVCDPEWIALPEGFSGGEADIAALTDIALAEEAGLSIRLLGAGDMVKLSDEIVAEVLYPETGMEHDGGNESSMLMRVSYGSGSVLFTGDLPMTDEPMNLPECTVLKVPHHGSAASTSTRFLANVRPTLAVISVGEGNLYGHPRQEVLDRLAMFGCATLRTDVHGAITVSIESNGSVSAETYFPIAEQE